MRYLRVSVALIIAGGVFAIDARPKVKESVASPRGWVKHGLPHPQHNINLRIGLPQPNFGVLEQHLYEVSDPSHERYGQHLSKEEVESLVAPPQESIDTVDEWLASFGVKESDVHRSPAKDWIKLKVPVSLAEEMLNTTYYTWKHLSSGDLLVRTTSYSLPSDLHAHIDVVQPTTLFGRFKGSKSTIVTVKDAPNVPRFISDSIDPGNGLKVDPSCNETITISCLEQLYNSVGYKSTGKGSIGITGYLEQNANIQDLQSFFAEQRPDAVGSNFTFISVAGGVDNQTLAAAGIEGNLDVQFAFGISHPIPGTYYSTTGSPPFITDINTPTDTNEPYTDWLDFVLSHPNPPLAISTSYDDDEQTVPESFAKRACQGFAQLGVRGVSLVFSSGNFGVGDGDPDPATHTCFTNDGRNATRFIPGFPAGCPFVTTVGGTSNIPEVAVSSGFFSGGGFSDYFDRPIYQELAVKAYLDSLPQGTYKGLFNPNGRGYPDVSAQSNNFRLWLSGQPTLIGGTSAATPTFTGFVALLNDARLRKNLPPLGFLNPLLYTLAAHTFNDITVGHNSGCGTTGFNATKGWDPVTGLGTPNFGKLLGIVAP